MPLEKDLVRTITKKVTRLVGEHLIHEKIAESFHDNSFFKASQYTGTVYSGTELLYCMTGSHALHLAARFSGYATLGLCAAGLFSVIHYNFCNMTGPLLPANLFQSSLCNPFMR